ncbi:MAG: nitroreductase family protein [Anaerolineales bacterium]|nr:nitroreductase family protein [Anaerolineales bacterium]
MIQDADFWEYLDRLVAESRVVIDRPRLSPHPRYPNLIYPLDYGYLQATTAIDGGGIDVWLGSLPERRLAALALTVDLEKRDAEIKLLLGCTADETQVVMDFLNGASMRALLVRREAELDFLRTRRSVRCFLARPVSRTILKRLIEVATWAPSSHNCQPWRFAVLTDPQARSRLALAMGVEFRNALLADGLSENEADRQVEHSLARIQEAPAAILLCLDTSQGAPYPDRVRQRAEYLMGVQSVALAGGHILLAAHLLGLSGVWLCAPIFAPEAANQALALPPTWQPQGLLLVGYPAKTPPKSVRRRETDIALFFEEQGS